MGELTRRIVGASNAIARPLAGRRFFTLWGIVHHRGRRSGREYATPVVIRPVEGGFITPLPFGQGTQWLQNVLAAGGATVRWNGTDFRMTEPTVIGLEEAAAAYSGIQGFTIKRAGIRQHLRMRTA